jgi:hypothetical protein
MAAVSCPTYRPFTAPTTTRISYYNLRVVFYALSIPVGTGIALWACFTEAGQKLVMHYFCTTTIDPSGLPVVQLAYDWAAMAMIPAACAMWAILAIAEWTHRTSNSPFRTHNIPLGALWLATFVPFILVAAGAFYGHRYASAHPYAPYPF